MANTPTQKPQAQRPQKPKSAAQRASEANTIQQHAVRTNTARPGDRRVGQAQLQNDHQTGAPSTRDNKQ
jgi:hypothetical protein